MAEKMSMSMGTMFDSNPLRKFRWSITIAGAPNATNFVRTFSRPSMTFEETELNFRHEKMWIAGKMTWDTVSMTVLDVEKDNGFYGWVMDTYNIRQGKGEGLSAGFANMGKDHVDKGQTGSYKRQVTLNMLDGHGSTIETWTLQNAWLSSVNWGDLDYSSSDTADIECTVRFDRAMRHREGEGTGQGGYGLGDLASDIGQGISNVLSALTGS